MRVAGAASQSRSIPSALGGLIVLAWLAVLPGAASAAPGPAQADPKDYPAVEQVCAACHNTSRIMHARNWSEWTEVFTTMAGLGASGSDAQWDQISRFFQETVTTLNVNKDASADIGPTLNVSDAVVTAILTRRAHKKFTGLADLAAIPGIDKARLEKIKSRLQF